MSPRRVPSVQTRAALDAALALTPSQTLKARRPEVRDVFARAGLPEPKVFGSVARAADRDGDLIARLGLHA